MSRSHAVAPRLAYPSLFQRTTLASAVFLACTSLAHGETESIETQQADTIVVVSTALKVATPLAETPRSASKVEREDMNLRNAQTIPEALNYTAGVLAAPYGADNKADWLKSRGFDQSFYRDGLRLFSEGFYTWQIEPFGLESIEVLKGPASTLYGQTPPGGIINEVSKRPTDEPYHQLQLQAGNWDRKQIAIDTSGPLNEQGDIRYRVVGLIHDNGSQVHRLGTDRYYLAPSLAIDLGDDTQLTLLSSFQKDTGDPLAQFWLPTGTLHDTQYGEVGSDKTVGEPDYDRLNRSQLMLGYEFDHRFNDTWSFAQNFRYNHLDLDLRTTYGLSVNDEQRTINRGLTYRDGTARDYTIDNRFVGHWRGDRLEHTLLLGVDYQHLDIDSREADAYSFGAPLDMYDPDYGNYTPVQSSDIIRRDITREQLGLYVQDEIRLDDRWVATVGTRYDHAKADNDNRTAGTGFSLDDEEMSWSAGLMYLADNGLSPYISYSESFEPTASTDINGNAYEPTTAKQYEAGVKYAPEGFDGFLSAAVFEIHQDNLLTTDPQNPYYQVQTGEARSRGVELEGTAYVTDQWKLHVAYTYTEAEQRKSTNEDYIGKQLPLIPKHQAKLWSDYSFEGGAAEGLVVGGGVRYVGHSYGDQDNSSEYRVGSYALLDAMARYQLDENWQLQLNVDNLTDREYVASCNYYCYYGQRRSILTTVSYNW
ncbi:TonB-dependent siderophore receptor [Phytohalomonas tamaricis]|uniref:TonB-dependent siderophore receptor n=1 Tax=Phytohalomonas tamaricis TaxID=2081032 RepID=UPI000D0B4567|nr:TonB-dependent siderophore receptor [Phytohalomonas tamaricis]